MRRLLLVLPLLAVAGSASAYVLPADYLLKMLADKRRDAKLKDLSATLDVESSGETVEERLYLKRPERLRTVVQSEGGAVWVEREGVRGSGTEAKIERWKGPVTDLTAVLLFPRGKDNDESGQFLYDTIKAAGVEVSLVSMARWEDKHVYVIGARPWEPEKPQIWINKETFLPIRVLLVDKSKKELVETRYLDFGSALTGNHLPRVVETYRSGKLVRRAEVTELKTNQDLPETLFDVP